MESIRGAGGRGAAGFFACFGPVMQRGVGFCWLEGLVLKLACGKDLVKLGIRNSEEGLNITAFLDHVEGCEQCGQEKGALVDALNRLIGGEETD